MLIHDIRGFDWDEGNREKCQKHGVSLAEIEALLATPGLPVGPDVKHSVGETRFVAMGRNEAKRPLFVVFTFRARGGALLLRPLSARYMHAKEAARYEQEDPRI